MAMNEQMHMRTRRGRRIQVGGAGSPQRRALWALRVLLILALALGALTACGDAAVYEEMPAESGADAGEQGFAEDALAEEEAGVGAGAAAQGEPGTWLVMLYQDADDETLERDMFIDLNEAEIVGSTEAVTIVAQLDRYEDGFDGDGDWTGTRRYRVTQGDDLEAIESEEIEDLGEVDMSDPQTLVDFATWAMATYPAERYALIMSDHGMGWLGGWSDPDPEGGEMEMYEIDEALAAIVAETGVGQLDLFGFDACLMAQIESMSAVAPYARYAVASEETEPAVGWAYASFLGALADEPTMDGAALAEAVVDAYIDQDWRIVDDAARRVFLEENYDVDEEWSADEVAADMGADVTLTAVDLGRLEALHVALNDLALALAAADPGDVAAARAYAQAYTSVFDKEYPDSFVDLGHLAQVLAEETGDADVTDAAQAVLDALGAAVLAEKHGHQRPGSTGLSIYFPNSELFAATADADFVLYTQVAGRFAAASLWDDFLAYHYTGKDVDAAAADTSVLRAEANAAGDDFAAAIAASAPEEGAEVTAPGGGAVSVGEVSASAEEVAPDESVTLSAEISGEHLGYLYYYASLYFPEDDTYMVADRGYLAAEDTHTVGGLTYPDWGGDTAFTIEFEWEPAVYYLSDGEDEVLALLEPEVYGRSAEEDVYTIYGLYAPGGDEAERREALIRFDGELEMASLWVFTGTDGAGAPREAALAEGDTFTVWQLWQEYDEEAEDWVYAYYEGDTLTCHGAPFSVAVYDAFPGDYEVGIVAENYDGDQSAAFAAVTVAE